MHDVIPEPIEFEWDKGNLNKNLEKHGVTNDEIERVFFDEKAVFTEDIKHSFKEKRYQIIGKNGVGKVLNIIFTTRSKRVRVISARPVNKKERKLYEQKGE